jgi:hypothetical protein
VAAKGNTMSEEKLRRWQPPKIRLRWQPPLSEEVSEEEKIRSRYKLRHKIGAWLILAAFMLAVGAALTVILWLIKMR